MLQPYKAKIASGLTALTLFQVAHKGLCADTVQPTNSSTTPSALHTRTGTNENTVAVSPSARFSDEAIRLFKASSNGYTQGKRAVQIDNGSAENTETILQLCQSTDPHISRAAQLMCAIQVCGKLEVLFTAVEPIEDTIEILRLSQLVGDTLSKQIAKELSEIEKIQARADVKAHLLEILPVPQLRWYALQYIRSAIVREASIEMKAILKSSAAGVSKNLTALNPQVVDKEWQAGILSIKVNSTNALENCAIVINPRMDKPRMIAEALAQAVAIELLNQEFVGLPPEMVHRMHMLNFIKVATETQGQPLFLFIPKAMPREITRVVFIPPYLSKYFVDIEFTASTERTESTVLARSPNYAHLYPGARP